MSAEPRFVDQGNGTVKDTATGLVWLRDANPYGQLTWNQAVAKAAKLKSGTNGLKDRSRAGSWRVPTMMELTSLLDFRYTPALSNADVSGPWSEGDPWIKVDADSIYWSGTPAQQDTKTLAWWVDVNSGNLANDYKKSRFVLWPVRGRSKVPKPRFTDHGDGTVTDNKTGVVWLKNADYLGPRTWADAAAQVGELATGAGGLSDGSVAGDWRLPSQPEMISLLDYNYVLPTISNTQGTGQLTEGDPFDRFVTFNLYWSGTSAAGDGSVVWGMLFGTGNASTTQRNGYFHVWPVKRGQGENAAERPGTARDRPGDSAAGGGTTTLPTWQQFRAFLAPYEAFVIARFSVKKPAEFAVFGEDVSQTFHAFGGRHVFLGKVAKTYLGQDEDQLAMILAFPRQKLAAAWLTSEAFASLEPLLEQAANAQIVSYDVATSS